MKTNNSSSNETASEPEGYLPSRHTYIVCGTFYTEFESPGLRCQSCTKCYHPTCAEMPLYYMIKYLRSTMKFQ